MLQIIVSVVSLQNGSRKAVSGCGITSMSDSLIACQPRIEEPSKPRPSWKVDSSRWCGGMVKCCQVPGKSQNRRSMALTSFSRMSVRTSFGVIQGLLKNFILQIADCRLRKTKFVPQLKTARYDEQDIFSSWVFQRRGQELEISDCQPQ